MQSVSIHWNRHLKPLVTIHGALHPALLRKISYPAKQFSDAVIHARINYRIQLCKVNIKSIFARNLLIYLNIPDSAEKSGRISGFD